MENTTTAPIDIATMYDESTPMSNAFNDGQVHLAYWYDAVDEASMREASQRITRRVGESLGLRPGQRVLDIGCGLGTPALELAQDYGVTVVGINISRVQVEEATKRAASANLGDSVTFQHGDWNTLDFPDGSFDAIVAMETLLYATDLDRVLRGLFRVLRPGGRLALTETTRESSMGIEEAAEFAATFNAQFLKSTAEWLEALTAAGFEFHEYLQCGPRVFGKGPKYVAEAESQRAHLTEKFGAEAVDELGKALGYYFEAGAGKVGYAVITAGRPLG
ncbi:methyltransferase domain-containing protein [Micromonospora sp. NPDC005171]|uniref:class I SAM-dependent methyltransferase n=1 Tax=Micromonospora sp. NPDC005171 TaxID=3156866 RepID=UPI0033BE888D